MTEDTITMQSLPLSSQVLDKWFDSFDPRVRTHIINFYFNTMKTANFDPSNLDQDDAEFSRILSHHFYHYINMNIMNLFPDRAILGWHPIPK